MTNAPRILVIDDDLHIRRPLHGALTRAAYQVLEARDGREALALVRGRPTRSCSTWACPTATG